MMGFEPIPRFSRERILSPLRLPFRHIGARDRILRDIHYIRESSTQRNYYDGLLHREAGQFT